MKALLLSFFCVVCISQHLLSQAAISYYPITSYIGISTNPDRRIWGDYRLQTNTFVGFSNMEFCPKVNVKRTEVVKVYVGAGVNVNGFYGAYDSRYINGYLLCSGVMVSPFRTARGFNFIFEISPYVNYAFSDGIIRTTLGVGWHFKTKKGTARANKRPGAIMTPSGQ